MKIIVSSEKDVYSEIKYKTNKASGTHYYSLWFSLYLFNNFGLHFTFTYIYNWSLSSSNNLFGAVLISNYSSKIDLLEEEDQL
jgi:hypothetical protein